MQVDCRLELTCWLEIASVRLILLYLDTRAQVDVTLQFCNIMFLKLIFSSTAFASENHLIGSKGRFIFILLLYFHHTLGKLTAHSAEKCLNYYWRCDDYNGLWWLQVTSMETRVVLQQDFTLRVSYKPDSIIDKQYTACQVLKES